MTAYTLDIITADFEDFEREFPAGIPVEFIGLGSQPRTVRILVNENEQSYILVVPDTVILIFDSPIDMAGIQ